MKSLLKKSLNILLSSTFTVFSFNIHANLLSNPGFESGLTDWQSTNNVVIRTGDPLAYEGTNYIFGENTGTFTIWQDIDLINSGVSAAQIDTGNLNILFGGWQSGWNGNDMGQITVRLFDTNNIEIAANSLTAFTSSQQWTEQSGTISLLSGTRFIRYEFTGTKNSGINNDAYLDAATLDVTFIDRDGDGLFDYAEDINNNGIVDPGETDPLDYDSDDDGLSDGYEVNVSGTDPTSTTTLAQPGDMNADSVLNAGDLLLLQKKILGIE